MPSRKDSRLSMLSLREEGLRGRMCLFVHCPTYNVLCDGITKVGALISLVQLMTTRVHGIQKIGKEVFHGPDDH